MQLWAQNLKRARGKSLAELKTLIKELWMAVWLIRAGSQGQFEQKFLNEKRVFVTWSGLNSNLAKMTERDELFNALSLIDPEAKPKKLAS